ncbi:MAG: hypothetical protein FJ008_08850 [Chloroflexi bacterium]|nr:hypothetical protein [Chloroflexota bacterium]
MSLTDLLDRVLSILRDNAFEGIGTIFAVLVVIVPWISRRLKSDLSNTRFRRMFWWWSVPTLSVLTTIAAIWDRVELVIVFSAAIAILHLVRQRETSIAQAELEQECKKLTEARRKESGSTSVSPYKVIKGSKKVESERR